MKKKRVIIPLCCILLLSGCSSIPIKPPATGAETMESQAESLLSEADLDYVVPVSVPNILVNQEGYLPGSKKIAVFRGENIPETFQLIEAETGKVVYEGEIADRGYNTYTEESISYGDFSEVIKPGEYYVEAQVVGRSYFFAIDDGVYDGIFQNACKQYYYSRCGITLTEELAGSYAHSACHTRNTPLQEDATVSLDVSGGWHQDESGSKDVRKACNVLNVLLLAYELNEENFTDDLGIPESGNQIPDLMDEIRYEADWLLKMQDTKTGGVYSGIAVHQSANNISDYTDYVKPASAEATAAYCATMAKFSYLYQNFDTAYATKCLKAADRAWQFLVKNYSEELEKQRFLAAAELYRAAGYWTYHAVVKEFLGKGSYKEDMDEEAMLGCITYISTKMQVDKNLCGDIMKAIMLYAEEISANARKSQYLTAGNRQQDNIAELLQDMFYLSIVNHIIKNHEYGTVIENHLHYFLGRNSLGISYIDGIGAKNYKDIDIKLGIMNQIDLDSKLIFMLGEIKSNHSPSD